MKRSSVRFVFGALLAGCVALPVAAGDRAGVVVAERPGPSAPGDAGLGRFLLCLRILDLTPAQKADILGVLDASKPILQADADAIKADAQKLRSDIESGADKCVIGQDTLDLRAAEKTLYADTESVKDQILSKLTDDQKKRLRGCLDAPPTAAGASTGDGSE
jgi:hypothetical protein